MDTINGIANQLLEPLGGCTRNFVVNYRDAKNKCFNIGMTAIQPCGVALNLATLTESMIQSLESKGYTVYCIYELLNGCTDEELERIAKADPAEARKHANMLYLDFRKEWAQ